MLTIFTVGLLVSALRTCHAVQVYLSPQNPFVQHELLPDEATTTLSHHLGLEQFEPLRDTSNANYEENFIGQGAHNVLLLTLDSDDVDAVLPDSMRPTFTLATPSPVYSLSSVISTYLHRARHVYESVFDAWNLRNHHSLSEFFKSAEGPAFAGVELSNLVNIRERLGKCSEQYKQAVAAVRDLLEEAQEDDSNWRVAVITFDSQTSRPLSKREPSPQQSPLPSNRPPPQEPIGSVSTCFSTLDACVDGTNNCSGRGQCVGASKAGKTCFICTCKATKTGEGKQTKTEYWVGQSCERKDVSGPFVLLSGTAIILLLLSFGSIYLLSAVGDAELPSTLMATAVNAKRD